MGKTKLYTYNPETDNFERFYPSIKSRLLSGVKIGGMAIIIALIIFLLVFYAFDSPTEENLRHENELLRTQYSNLTRRLETSLKVIDRLKDRDENFYRVMMQLEPLNQSQRLSGLENEGRYRELERLGDAALIKQVTQRLDLMERQLFAQVQSFDQLKDALLEEKEKVNHVPAIIPVDKKVFSLASGYGVRKDPIMNRSKFHEGVDITASSGTPVLATGDGTVEISEKRSGEGNFIQIDHGYEYTTRYSHLSELSVKAGDKVKRGEVIGKIGSSGISSGPHLHYEVRYKGETQNPINFMFMDFSPEEFTEIIQRSENAGYVME